MRIVCQTCRTEYDIELPESARKKNKKTLKFRCSACGETFQARIQPEGEGEPPAVEAAAGPAPEPRPEPEPLGDGSLDATVASTAFQPSLEESLLDLSMGDAPAAPQAGSAAGDQGMLLRQDGKVYHVKDLATMQRWIVERRVSASDEVSRGGDDWMVVSEHEDLQPFMDVVDQADRAADLGAQVGMLRDELEKFQDHGHAPSAPSVPSGRLAEETWIGPAPQSAADLASAVDEAGDEQTVAPSPGAAAGVAFGRTDQADEDEDEDEDDQTLARQSSEDEQTHVDKVAPAPEVPFGPPPLSMSMSMPAPSIPAPPTQDEDHSGDHPLDAERGFGDLHSELDEPTADSRSDAFTQARPAAHSMFDEDFDEHEGHEEEHDDYDWGERAEQGGGFPIKLIGGIAAGVIVIAALAGGAWFALSGSDEADEPSVTALVVAAPAEPVQPVQPEPVVEEKSDDTGTAAADAEGEGEATDGEGAGGASETTAADAEVEVAAAPPVAAPTPKETAPKQAAPKETAPKETAPKQTPPKETAPKETPPKQAAVAAQTTAAASASKSAADLKKDGWAAVSAGDLVTARRSFDLAVAASPSSGDAHYGLGYVARKQGDSATAVGELCKAARLAGGNINLARQIATELRQMSASCN